VDQNSSQVAMCTNCTRRLSHMCTGMCMHVVHDTDFELLGITKEILV
jgi:hypothetical protein